MEDNVIGVMTELIPTLEKLKVDRLRAAFKEVIDQIERVNRIGYRKTEIDEVLDVRVMEALQYKGYTVFLQIRTNFEAYTVISW